MQHQWIHVWFCFAGYFFILWYNWIFPGGVESKKNCKAGICSYYKLIFLYNLVNINFTYQLKLCYYTSQLRYVSLDTCRIFLGWTKLSNSLWKQKVELSTHTWSGHAPWKHSKFWSKQFLCNFFSISEFGGIIKCLMTGPAGTVSLGASH